jgi:predicted  nucleic acid-binding Zn-ribbon protein
MTEQPPKLANLRRRVRRFRPTRTLVSRMDGRVERVGRQQESLRDRVERQAKQIDALKATVAAMKEKSLPLEQEANRRLVQHSRISHQVGVLEERMGRLEEQLSTGVLSHDDAAMAEARSIVDAVRREHEQVRIRVQIVSHYEERLRRVEAAVESIAEGDVRRIV